MTMLKRFSPFLIVAAMLSMLGCATQSEPQSASAYMGDAWVTTQVKAGIVKAVKGVTAVKNDMRLR